MNENCPICGLPIDSDEAESCECEPRERDKV